MADSARKINPNRLYFGNVSFEKTQEQITEFFSQCGAVEDVYLVKDKFTGRFQGYGFITFAEDAGKDAALQLDKTDFEGRPIKVNLETRASDKTGSGQRLFIKNIPADKTEEDLKQAFAQYGTPTDFFFVRDRVTKVSKGFGFLDMSTAEEAKAALAMDGEDPFGTGGLSVKIAHKKKPVQSFAPPYGGGYGQQYNPYQAGGFGGPWGGRGGFRGRGGRGRGGRGRGGRGGYGGPPPAYGASFGGPYGAPQGGAYGAPQPAYGAPQGGAYGAPQQSYGAPQGGAYGGQGGYGQGGQGQW